MCRSIKILRAPYSADVTEEELRAAARAYLRTVSGYRLPPAPAEAAFDRAVEAVTATTRDLLAEVEQAGRKSRPP